MPASRHSEHRPTSENLKPFVKGQSGNPGGRPKVAAEFRERAQHIMDQEGFDILVNMARAKTPESEDRRYALTKLIEYAYGKPQQHVDVTSQGEQIKAYVGVELDRV